ncbi:MAG: hypothetical protein WD738_09990 [Pirellulales bacterium]
MTSRFATLRFFALGVCLLALFFGLQPAWADPAIYQVGDDPAVGFNLISWWNFGGSGASTWQNAVQGLYNAGFRDVSISPVRFVNINTGAILATSQRGPELSHIEAGVVRAKSLGMRVTLNPFVELFDAHGTGTADDEYFADLPGGCTWRGCWNPTAGGAVANQFWSDYQNYLGGVAQIASNHNVDAMTVGTEYKALNGNSGHNAKWSSAINAVADAYQGPLGYAANWDDYRNGNLTTAIWEHPEIDFIGIDSYFDSVLYDYFKYQNPGATNSQIATLVDSAVNPIQGYPDQAFIDLMTDAWNKFLDIDSPTQFVSGSPSRTYFAHDGILSFAAARKGGAGMPVVFTEQGYPYFNTGAKSPQVGSGSADTAEQRMAFQGLMNALDGRSDVFEAMHVWQWGMPGSDGSQWNMDTTLPANQPDNVPASQWLAQFVGTAELPLAGDYNRDGNVDAADYAIWRKNMGQFVLQYSGADGDGNGIIGAGDYAAWRANFGSAMGGGAVSSVPEPAARSVLLCAVATALFGLSPRNWRAVRV